MSAIVYINRQSGTVSWRLSKLSLSLWELWIETEVHISVTLVLGTQNVAQTFWAGERLYPPNGNDIFESSVQDVANPRNWCVHDSVEYEMQIVLYQGEWTWTPEMVYFSSGEANSSTFPPVPLIPWVIEKIMEENHPDHSLVAMITGSWICIIFQGTVGTIFLHGTNLLMRNQGEMFHHNIQHLKLTVWLLSLYWRPELTMSCWTIGKNLTGGPTATSGKVPGFPCQNGSSQSCVHFANYLWPLTLPDWFGPVLFLNQRILGENFYSTFLGGRLHNFCLPFDKAVCEGSDSTISSPAEANIKLGLDSGSSQIIRQALRTDGYLPFSIAVLEDGIPRGNNFSQMTRWAPSTVVWCSLSMQRESHSSEILSFFHR